MATSGTAPFRLPWTPGAALFTGPPTPARVQESFPLGIAARLLADAGRERLSIASLIAWLETPIRLGQILFLTSWERIPLGFATWAYLTPATLQAMASGRQDLPLLDDWNEGAELWLVDFVAPNGHAGELVRHLREQLGARHDVVHYRRNGRYGRTRFRPATTDRFPAWGAASATGQADLMFDQTGHIPSSPVDIGWLAPAQAADAAPKRLAQQARPR
jgi:hemolysin-activating ACP:hemolysin acyltransferase